MSPDRLTPFYASLPAPTRGKLAEMMRYLTLWIVFRDPPEHTRVRGLVSTAFLPGTINSFRSKIAGIASRLLDELGSDNEVDLVARFTMPLPALVIMSMLGVSGTTLNGSRHGRTISWCSSVRRGIRAETTSLPAAGRVRWRSSFGTRLQNGVAIQAMTCSHC